MFTYKIFSFDKLSKKELQKKHRQARWIHISETYDQLMIICCLKDERDVQKRFQMEQYIAIKTHAQYWNDIKKFTNSNLECNEMEIADKLIEEINEEIVIKSKKQT